MEMNLGETAECFGVEPNTIKQWVTKGCPVIQKGSQSQPWVICPKDVSDWLREREREEMAGQIEKTDLEEARRRKLAAEAAIVELELMRKRGEVVPIADVASAMGQEWAACKARLLSLPTKMAAIAPANIRNELREGLDDGIRECLAEIVSYTPGDDTDHKAA